MYAVPDHEGLPPRPQMVGPRAGASTCPKVSLTPAGEACILVPMDSTFLNEAGAGVRRVAIGPRRSPAERLASLAGGLLGAVIAMATGVALLGLAVATAPAWQQVPPPIEPFVLLPVPVGLFAGLRLTTELTRPAHLRWRRVLGTTGIVLVLSVASVTLLGVGIVGARPLDYLLGVPLLSAAFIVFPGVVIFPFLVPPVALFAVLMRTISRSTGPATNLRAAE